MDNFMFLPMGRVQEIIVSAGDKINGVQVIYDVQGTTVRGHIHRGEHGHYRTSSLVLDVAAGEVGPLVRHWAGKLPEAVRLSPCAPLLP